METQRSAKKPAQAGPDRSIAEAPVELGGHWSYAGADGWSRSRATIPVRAWVSIRGNRSMKRAPASAASSRRTALKRRIRAAISDGAPNAAATGVARQE